MQGTTQANVNTKETGANSYNAIMIGSGISGGWAEKELCEKSSKILAPNVEKISNTSKVIQHYCKSN